MTLLAHSRMSCSEQFSTDHHPMSLIMTFYNYFSHGDQSSISWHRRVTFTMKRLLQTEPNLSNMITLVLELSLGGSIKSSGIHSSANISLHRGP